MAAVASVSMDDTARTARSVAAVASVITGDGVARTARSVDAARSGSESRPTVTMTHQRSVSHHRQGSSGTRGRRRGKGMCRSETMMMLMWLGNLRSPPVFS